MSEYKIEHTELKRCDLVKLSGRFDTSRAAEVGETLQGITNEGRFRFVLDMSEAEYVSSGFLRVLVSTQKMAKRWNRGDIYLAAPTERVRSVLELAGLMPLFQVYDTVPEAVGAW